VSLLDIHLQPNRALVAVDTEIMNAATSEYAHGSKMTLLPHGNMVLAIRGINAALGFVFVNALMTWPTSFDAIASAIPEYLRHTLDHFEGNAVQLFGRSAEEAQAFDQELAFVGYSESRSRMCALVFSTKGSKEVSTFELQERDAYFSPWTEAWGEPADPSSEERMRFIAQVQVDNGAAMEPNAPLGGKLLLCELTKDEAKFSSLGVLHSVRGSEAGGQADAPR
jgi:hypothetical protein